jgi:hypothetical protein
LSEAAIARADRLKTFGSRVNASLCAVTSCDQPAPRGGFCSFRDMTGSLARFPPKWTHLVDKTSRHFNMVGQILIAEPVSTSAGFL